MSRAPKDGRVLSSGVVRAAEIASGLGLSGAEPREGKVPDTPAQARLRAEGKDREADALARDDFEVTILDAAEHYGLWGSPELSAPPGSPDGTPVPLPPPARPQPQKTDWAKIDEAKAERPLTPNEQAEQIRQATRADIERTKARVAQAMKSGTTAEREAAADDARQVVALAQRVKEKIGL